MCSLYFGLNHVTMSKSTDQTKATQSKGDISASRVNKQSGKPKILESRLLKDIEKLLSARTKFRVWSRDLAKNRDPDFLRAIKMQGSKHEWCEQELDEVMQNSPPVRYQAWGIDDKESIVVRS